MDYGFGCLGSLPSWSKFFVLHGGKKGNTIMFKILVSRDFKRDKNE
jgi:hypothetical protein